MPGKTDKDLLITKASGALVPFSAEKLKKSLRRSGAGEEVVLHIVNEIEPTLYTGISTKKIYKLAFSLLKDRSRHLAAKYHLKKAIMELGPTGFPFERYIAELLKHQGYEVRVGEVVKGHCVNHEIDVIAEKENHHFMIECKFHNLSGTVCDVKIPLYIQARFKDVERQWVQLPGHGTKFHQGWVVTNTKFSGDAVQYGTCAGLNLLGWNYPVKNSLKDQIDRLGLYPVTCLTSLTRNDKQRLLEENIVLCRDIKDHKQYLDTLIGKPSRVNEILKESQNLCQQLTVSGK